MGDISKGVASTSNVKTVKEKRSTNVPQTSRHLTENETITSEFVLKSGPSKEHISIKSRRADSGPIKTICSLQDKFGNDFKTFLVSFSKRYRNISPSVFDITSQHTLASQKNIQKNLHHLKLL